MIIDAALGTIYVILLLSIICTALNEMWATIWKSRGRHLLHSIGNLIEDKETFWYFQSSRVMTTLTQGMTTSLKGTVDDVFQKAKELPIVSDKFQKTKKRAERFLVKKSMHKISYLPGETFADALLECVFERDINASELTFSDIKNQIRIQLQQPADAEVPGYDDGSIGKRATVVRPEKYRLGDRLIILANKAEERFHSVEEGKEALPMTFMREEIALWYDGYMDRVAGRYKAKTQKFLAGISIVLVLAVNADLLMVVKTLSSNANLRETSAALAEALNESQVNPDPNPEGEDKEELSEAQKTRKTIEDSAQKLDDLYNLGI
ncbi:MAG: hypothetical protein F6K19_47060, partial [Cyanothece sp. SIO1E1]|nr:hypothetical protein [Cyanothece sp. SIO1E1]